MNVSQSLNATGRTWIAIKMTGFSLGLLTIIALFLGIKPRMDSTAPPVQRHNG
jgi:hypothetical protein